MGMVSFYFSFVHKFHNYSNDCATFCFAMVVVCYCYVIFIRIRFSLFLYFKNNQLYVSMCIFLFMFHKILLVNDYIVLLTFFLVFHIHKWSNDC